MAKKRKMTKAQAAAARKDVSPQDELKARSRAHGQEIRAMQSQVQKKANKSVSWQMVVLVIAVVAIVVLAMVFTVAPSMFIGAK